MKITLFLKTLFAAFALVALATTARAQNLTYSLFGVGSGNIIALDFSSSVAFTDTAFRFTLTADPNQVTSPVNDLDVTPVGTLNLVFGNQTTQIPFSAFFVSNDPANNAYDAGIIGFSVGSLRGTTSNGPLTLTSPQSPTPLTFFSAAPIPTEFGFIEFTSTSSLTFASTTTVPEPAFYQMSVLIVGLGAPGIFVIGKRRVRS